MLQRAVVIVMAGNACGAIAAEPCGPWINVPAVDRGSISNLLYDVAFDGPQNGLAVGNFTNGVGMLPSVQRWNGTQWSDFPLPSTGALGNLPTVEGVISDGEGFWVVGSVFSGYPTDNLPLILRWENGDWVSAETATLRPQNTHPFGPRGGTARDAVTMSPDDAWVVGSAAGYGDASATSVPLALHFDGSGWEDVEVPLVGNRTNSLIDVSASSTSNVWAVGSWRNIAQNFQALVVRWDGSAWNRVANPGERPEGGDATCVAAFSPQSVWVSGNFGPGDHLIHWDGDSWESVDAGLPGPFADMIVIAPDDIWGSCAINATYYHYNGEEWSPVEGPVVAGSSFVLRGWGLAAVDACDVWSVGGWSDGSAQYTLSERLTRAACGVDWNNDGSLNFFDVSGFLVDYAAADARADMNQDGQHNFFDVSEFLAAYNAGCP